jgi:hypothetical protein
MSSHNYRGMSFDAWTNQQTWFWSVVNPNRNGGTIGAAATEVDAVREACMSIDETSAERRGCAAVWRAAAGKASTAAFRQTESTIVAGWERSLASLERYLSGASRATA